MRPRALIKWLKWGDSAASRRWSVALGVIFVVLAVFLRVSGSEWREAVSERVAKTEKRYSDEGRQFEDAAAREHAVFKSVKLGQWIHSGMHWAALANLVLIGALLLTLRWWCGQGVKEPESGVPPGSARFWWVVLAALLVALAVRAPRMGLSLYNDEAYNFRHYIHGQFKEADGGGLSFDRVTWQETFWKNKANNGVPFSALARLGDSVWRSATGAADGEIGEAALRWAALVPGLLSIVVVALLGRRLGGVWVGGAAAVWLALHPWHLRYCTEARPYGLVLLFAALALLCLCEALRGDRWRWWLGFGASQFMLVWCFAGAVYFAAGINVAALGFCFLRGGRRGMSGRLVVSSLLSAMLYVQLMAPCFPQMLHTLGTVDSFKGHIGPGLVADLASYLAVGMPAIDRDPANLSNPALAKIWPLGALLLVACVLVLLVAAWPAVRRPREWRVLLGGGVLSLAFALAMSLYSGGVLHRWYVIYAIPCVALGFAAGWVGLWQKGGRLRLLGGAVAGVMIVLMAMTTADYLGRGKQSLREAVEVASEGDALVAGLWTDAGIYLPSMRRVQSLEDLEKAMADALASGRELSVVIGHWRFVAAGMPDCLSVLEGEGFRVAARFRGLEEEQFTTVVYRTGSAEGSGNRSADE